MEIDGVDQGPPKNKPITKGGKVDQALIKKDSTDEIPRELVDLL